MIVDVYTHVWETPCHIGEQFMMRVTSCEGSPAAIGLGLSLSKIEALIYLIYRDTPDLLGIA